MVQGQSRLPEEILEVILTDHLSKVLHDAFTFATTWTLDSSSDPLPVYKLSYWCFPNVVKSWSAYDGKVLSRLEEERVFIPILAIAHASRQFRRIVQHVLSKLCPVPFRDEEFATRVIANPGEQPLLSFLRTLQNLFDQFTEVIYKASQEDHKSAKEVLAEIESKNTDLLKAPFVKVHFLNTKIRSYIYTLYGPSYFDAAWEPNRVIETAELVKSNLDMNNWNRRFLNRSLYSLAHSYRELELGSAAQELQTIFYHHRLRGLEDDSAISKFAESDVIESLTSDLGKAAVRGRDTLNKCVERLEAFTNSLRATIDAKDLHLKVIRPTNAVVTVLEERLKVQYWNESALKVVQSKDLFPSMGALAEKISELGSLRDLIHDKIAPGLLEQLPK